MKLMIMRHGKAVYSRTLDEQILTGFGRKQVRKQAEYLKDNFEISHIIHSPKLRAVQTAGIIKEFFPEAKVTEYDKILPHSDTQNIIEDLDYLFKKENTLIVSHMPFVCELSREILNSRDRKNVSFFETAEILYLERLGDSFILKKQI